MSQQQESASTGSIPKEILKAATYAGLVYYEEKGVEDLVTFTAAKKLDALVQVRMTIPICYLKYMYWYIVYVVY